MRNTQPTAALNSKLCTCFHCHEPVVTPFHDEANNTFCCQGCRSVYTILNEYGFEDFYRIQKETGEYTAPVSPIKPKDYNYLNQEEFQKSHTKEDSGSLEMTFYLKGIHCIACIWLIEKLPEMIPQVAAARLNLSQNTVQVKLQKNSHDFASVARLLNKLGYSPTPIGEQKDLEACKTEEERSLLLKIGVAGFSTMNIMLYTLGIYAGAPKTYADIFSYVSFGLSLPVIFYAALPFYQSAFRQLQSKRITLDLPLSFALIFGFSASTYSLFTGSTNHYFDSLATLTFLILLSRYVLKKATWEGFKNNELISFFQQGALKRVDPKTSEVTEIHHSQLKVEDTLKIYPGDTLPVDGKIISGETSLNLSPLTGESRPVHHKCGDHVFMGSINVGEPITIQAQHLGEETRLGQIFKEIEKLGQKRSFYTLITDKVSRIFVSCVLALTFASLLTLTFFYNLPLAIERSLALIIVTCPCALGLATPLVFSRLLNRGRRLGVIFKNESALEKAASVEKIIFDKTGTLTKGTYQVTDFQILLPNELESYSLEQIVFSLESISVHPVAHALIEWSQFSGRPLKQLPFEDLVDAGGQGVSGNLSGESFSLKPMAGNGFVSVVGLFKNKTLIAKFFMEDQEREEAQSVIKLLKERAYKLSVFSGDQKEIVQSIGKKLGFNREEIHWQLTPENKAALISEESSTLFVGDGANDALPLKKSFLGVSMEGAVEVSLRTSDILLLKNDLYGVAKALNLGKLAIKTIKQNLAFSLLYNIVGAGLALVGLIGPLEAAILMPLSSLTVFANTIYQTTKGDHLGNS